MRRLWLLGAVVAPLSLSPLGCGSDASGSDDESSSTGEADSGEAETTVETGEEVGVTTDETDTDTDTDTDTTDTTETTGGPIDDWARNIRISRVDANPGVAIPIAIDGEPTTSAERYTRIPARRATWLFVEVEVEAGWEARQIEARFTIHRDDGTTINANQIRTISRSTDEWQADPEAGAASVSEMAQFAGFYIGLPAEEILPGTGISLTLHEVDPSFLDQPDPAIPPSVPTLASGNDSVPLGVETSDNFFRLVMVPIALDSGGCTATPEYDEVNIQRYVDHLFSAIPVENIELVIHEPYPWTSALTSSSHMGQILSAMSQLKSDEGEEPYTYYYALINNCGGCISGGGMGCVAGLANLPGDGMGTGDSLGRVGSGLLSTSTFVHEIGHTQGRSHIECEGAGAAGSDPSYPHDNGVIGSWGFDMRELFLHHPDYGFDYMSYCGPSWTSDWQWEATYKRIETLSSWASDKSDPGPAADEQDLLVVSVHEDGSTSSFTARGWIDESRADTSVQISVGDSSGQFTITSTPVRVTETAHGAGRQYVFAAPSSTSASLRIQHAGKSYELSLSSLSN